MKKHNPLFRGCLFSAALTLATFAAGPLTPPGAPGDAPAQMPSLVEIKAAIDALATVGLNGRTAIPAQAATYTISAPGNYVLTGNITVANGDGIIITASNVTVDLNGFTVSSTNATPGGNGIAINKTVRGLVVRNGMIWSGATSAAPSTGFTTGVAYNADEISTDSVSCSAIVLEDLRIIGINGSAITRGNNLAVSSPGQAFVVRRVQTSCHGGIYLRIGASGFGKVIDCEVYRLNGAAASISASLIEHCVE